MIRQATTADILTIKRTANQFKNELGFVNRAALQDAIGRGTLLFDDDSGAFCHYRIRQRDGVCVVYEIAVPKSQQRRGIGRAIIDALPRPVRLKCPVNNSSNEFYRRLGFTLIGTEAGRKRALNVYECREVTA